MVFLNFFKLRFEFFNVGCCSSFFYDGCFLDSVVFCFFGKLELSFNFVFKVFVFLLMEDDIIFKFKKKGEEKKIFMLKNVRKIIKFCIDKKESIVLSKLNIKIELVSILVFK